MVPVLLRYLLSNVCRGHFGLRRALWYLADKWGELGCLLVSWLFHSDLRGASLRVFLSMTRLVRLNRLFCLKSTRAAGTLVKLLVYFVGLSLWGNIFKWTLGKSLCFAWVLFLLILNIYGQLLGSCLFGAWASHMGIRCVNLSLVQVFASRDVGLWTRVVVNLRILHAAIGLDTCLGGLGVWSRTLLRFLRVRWLLALILLVVVSIRDPLSPHSRLCDPKAKELNYRGERRHTCWFLRAWTMACAALGHCLSHR